MARTAAVILYVAGLLVAEALRVPRRVRRFRARPQRRRETRRWRPSEHLVMTAVVLGIWVLPLTYAFTNGLQRFDYSLPSWMSWVAAGIFIVGLLIRFSAQQTLGRQWSSTVEPPEGHRLVTAGIYGHIRHPIYASLVLWASSQTALLQNLVAGWSGAVAVALIWLLRVPREERMMLDEFDGEYAAYMARTGRLIPRRRPRGLVV